jgi:hypothetical protein
MPVATSPPAARWRYSVFAAAKSSAALATTVAVLALAGAAGGHIVAPVWKRIREREPVLRLETSATAGSAATLALLGGFRALAADMAWVELHAQWEKYDLAGTDALVRLVPKLDPRPVYFWVNGARIIAYDFTAWRIAAAGGYAVVPAETQEEIGRAQARLALAHLDRAMAYHSGSAELWIERACIELTRLHDVAAAAESFRRAAEQPGAPYYAARVHAEMLRRLGRDAEALAWLVRLHPTLPRNEEAAAAEVVLQRIHDLEEKLGVPPGRRYHPAP